MVTVHFKHNRYPILMLLNLVEVARSHSGVNLAEAFAKILEEFGIEDKVSFAIMNWDKTYLVMTDPQHYLLL